ncbi:MAG: hypothetical protein J0L58_20335, partial [Burkholderiales bacterium]|nr:hypothetical protein [Burkholderiales bacterium]
MKWPAIVFVLLVGAAGYAWKGNWHGFFPPPAPDPAEDMVLRLAERLKTEGGGAAEWAMLGRSYVVLERPAEAAAAYRSALKLEVRADWQVDLADLLASEQQGRFDGEPSQLIDAALAQDPDHLKALALAASRDWRAGRRDAARQH